MLWSMSQRNQTDLLILLLLIAFAAAGVATSVAFAAQERIDALAARVHTLERVPQYRGEDVNGNAVWSAQVTEVELPSR
jgi:hypothetical protein